MHSIQPASDCTHVWRQTGYWDGENKKTREDVNGPTVECTKCKGTSHFTWTQWERLAGTQRIAL